MTIKALGTSVATLSPRYSDVTPHWKYNVYYNKDYNIMDTNNGINN